MTDVKIVNVGGRDGVASEHTLQELLSATNGKVKSWNSAVDSSTAGMSRVVKNLSGSLRDIHNKFDDFGEDINDLGKNTKNSSNKLENFSKKISSTERVMGRTFGAVERGLDTLSRGSVDARGAVDMFGSALGGASSSLGGALTGAGLAGMFAGGQLKILGSIAAGVGVFLQLLGPATVAAAGTIGGVVGLLDGLRDSFYTISQSGFSVGGNLKGFIDNLLNSNLTLGQFANIVARNRTELAEFSGSVTAGANRFVRLRRAIEDEDLTERFRGLGIGLEELPDYIINYQNSLTLSGSITKRSFEELATGALEYAKRQKTLSDLTGKDIKSIQQESFARQSRVMVAGFLSDLEQRFPGVGEKFGSMMVDIGSRYGSVAEQFVNEMLVHGQTMSQETGLFASNMPAAAELLSEFVRDTAGGLQGNYLQKMIENEQKYAAQLEQERSTTLGIVPGLVTGPLATVQESLAETQLRFIARLNMTDEEIARISENIQAQADAGDKVVKSLGDLEEASQKVVVAVSGIATDIAASKVGETVADAVSGMADITSNGGDKLKTAIDAAAAAIKNQDATIAESLGLPTTGSNLYDAAAASLGVLALRGAGGGILGGLMPRAAPVTALPTFPWSQQSSPGQGFGFRNFLKGGAVAGIGNWLGEMAIESGFRAAGLNPVALPGIFDNIQIILDNIGDFDPSTTPSISGDEEMGHGVGPKLELSTSELEEQQQPSIAPSVSGANGWDLEQTPSISGPEEMGHGVGPGGPNNPQRGRSPRDFREQTLEPIIPEPAQPEENEERFRNQSAEIVDLLKQVARHLSNLNDHSRIQNTTLTELVSATEDVSRQTRYSGYARA